jgi:hypothetical protein
MTSIAFFPGESTSVAINHCVLRFDPDAADDSSNAFALSGSTSAAAPADAPTANSFRRSYRTTGM